MVYICLLTLKLALQRFPLQNTYGIFELDFGLLQVKKKFLGQTQAYDSYMICQVRRCCQAITTFITFKA